MNFRAYNPDQELLFPPALKDLIVPDDPVYVIGETIDRLDLSTFYDRYSNEGNPAYHPRMVVKLLVYAYARGVRSSRQIAQLVHHDIRFMYLAAMQQPDFRTLADFRKRHLPEFKGIFTQVVSICQQLQLIQQLHWAIDGSKLEANAGSKHGFTRLELEKQAKELEEEINHLLADAERIDQEEDAQFGSDRRGDELPPELRQARQRQEKIAEAMRQVTTTKNQKLNTTDPEARIMRHQDQKYDWSYNAQIAVDDHKQIIVAAEVTTEPVDYHQLVPLYEQAMENTGQAPAILTADSGYHTGANYTYVKSHDIDAYIPDKNQESDRRKAENAFATDHFIYHPDEDVFVCPQNHPLVFKRQYPERGVQLREYSCRDCPKCPDQKRCVSTRGHRRTMVVSSAETIKQTMRRKLDSPEGRRKYLRRQATVEPVWGYLKRQLGFSHFLLRGLDAVRAEFYLMTTAVNLLKMARCTLKNQQGEIGY
jgi:transposase